MFSSVISQPTHQLIIKGRVLNESRHRVKGVTLTLYKNNKKVIEKVTEINGRFHFTLEMNSKYELVGSKEAYLTNKYEFSTFVPSNVRPSVGLDWEFKFDIVLYEFVEGMTSTEPTLAEIGYDQGNNLFDYDEEYTAVRKSLLERSIDQIKAENEAKAIKRKKDEEEAEAKRIAEEEAWIAEGERLAKEDEIRNAEKERLAREAEATRAEEERIAKEKAEKKAEEERLANEAAAKKAEEERLAAEEAARKKAAEREAQRQAVADRMAKEAAKTRAYFIFLAEKARTEEEMAIRTAKAAEAFLQRKTDDSRVNANKEILEKEKEDIKIIELIDYEIKTTSKRRFLEEIADSKLRLKKEASLQMMNDK